MNITTKIIENARLFPHKKAVVSPIESRGMQPFRYEHITYRQFMQHAQNLSVALKEVGVQKGSRVLLFVKPSLEFPVLVFSLFSIGAIPILIDPGVGRKNLLKAIKDVAPTVLIGEPVVHLLKKIFRSSFRSVSCSISTKKIPVVGPKYNLRSLLRMEVSERREVAWDKIPSSDTAAIVYTSGATGAPKGVIYTHDMLYAQLDLMHRLIPDELQIDLSCFPLFALFTLGMGKTSVIPVMDVTKPAQVDPQNLVQHIEDYGISMATGSPAIWMRLADYCIERGISLSSLRGIIMFGAPVPVWLHQKLKKVMPNGETYTPYGATESLPVTWITGREILEHYREKIEAGGGVCVGRPVHETKVKILKNYETDSIGEHSAMRESSLNEIGEITVFGNQVTQQYFHNKAADDGAKISEQGARWHRMGDLGYFDAKGALWFCGRKRHAVQWNGKKRYSVMVEAIFNQHAKVRRSALIQLPGKAGIVLERSDRDTVLSEPARKQFLYELRSLGKKNHDTQDIDCFFLHSDFPVDCRHNIKIDRERLSQEFSGRMHQAL